MAGLLGLGGFSGIGGAKPPAGLLGPYFSPDEMKRQQMKQLLLGAGIGMLTNGKGSTGEVLGNSLGAGLQSANQAGQQYQQNAVQYGQLAQQQKEDRLKKQQHAAIMEWVDKLPPDQQGIAMAFPDKAAEAFLKSQAPDSPKWGITGEDQFGNKQYGYPPPYNPNAPQTQPNASMGGVAPPMGDSTLLDLHGEEFIQKLDPQTASQVTAIIEGRAPYPTGMLLKTPYGQKLASYVTQADPTFEAANANARAKVQADYSTGMIAKTNNALNTAIKHMQQMSDAVDSLKNYDQGGGLGPFTGTANTLKNAYLTESGDARVTNFKSISGKVAEELTRAYRGAGGAEADISREIEILNSSNSPTQLHQAIAKMADLLRSKIEANEAQYQSVMGPLVKHKPMISPEAQSALDVISGRATGSTQNQSAPSGVIKYDAQGNRIQ